MICPCEEPFWLKLFCSRLKYRGESPFRFSHIIPQQRAVMGKYAALNHQKLQNPHWCPGENFSALSPILALPFSGQFCARQAANNKMNKQIYQCGRAFFVGIGEWISGSTCGNVLCCERGCLRALPVADEASNKEWQQQGVSGSE